MASLTSLLVMATILALTIISIDRERKNFQKELIEQSDLLLEATSVSIRDNIYRTQVDEIVDIANKVSENPDVTFFIVYDDQGRILVDSRERKAVFSQSVDPLGGKIIKLKTADKYIEWQKDQLIAGRVITLGNDSIGAVSTGMSTIPLNEKITAITWQGIIFGFIVLLAGSLLTLIFSRQITLPLSELNGVVARMSAGDLTQRVGYRSEDEIGQLGKAFNKMAEELQERALLRDLFGRFVSPEIAEALQNKKVRLGGENRVISVLFCDIRGFTEFSERHSPEEVVELLNQFLPIVVQAAQKHGGSVNKFGGDSSLIIFGAPNDLDEHAYRALLTALDIREALKQLNHNLTSKGELPLRIGIGINTGVALAGAIGPNERQEYTVIGSTVNLAARIDGLNKQFPDHDILISGWTFEALERRNKEFRFVSLGSVPIRGNSQLVRVWSVYDKV